MAKVIDLPRVRRALADFDRIAAEHSDIRPITGFEQLEQLVMTTTNRERSTKHREKMYQQGCKKVTAYLPPNALAALDRLQDRTGKTRSEIIADAVINVALVDSGK